MGIQSKKAIIYKIYFDRNPDIVYIGVTTRTINRRLGDHIYKATVKKRPSVVYEWIRKNIKKAEIKIEEVCSCVDPEHRIDVEWQVIKQAIEDGLTLTNKLGVNQSVE